MAKILGNRFQCILQNFPLFETLKKILILIQYRIIGMKSFFLLVLASLGIGQTRYRSAFQAGEVSKIKGNLY